MRGGQGGAVTAIQRFGGGLQLNLHLHTLVLEGVFFESAAGALRFQPLPAPTDTEVARLLATFRELRGLKFLRSWSSYALTSLSPAPIVEPRRSPTAGVHSSEVSEPVAPVDDNDAGLGERRGSSSEAPRPNFANRLCVAA